MNCPTCDAILLISNREGIEIDYCPKCRGIWLDRGELDKIIERSAVNEKRWYRDEDEHDKSESAKQKKRDKSFLGDLFDIG